MEQQPKSKKNVLKIAVISFCTLILAFLAFSGIRATQFSKIIKNPESRIELTDEQNQDLLALLAEKYPENFASLKNLPFAFVQPELDVGAESAILINIANGSIIYEKNADEVIPPASMTKLFAMYVVDEAVSAGQLSYSDIIPLPPESWTCNMPPHSSLMFLGKDQIVTLEELLLGLSICSGNDAAYALAYTICGTMEDFVEKMNQVARDLDLQNTHFVESSGYSELNTTTAREMAKFCRFYLTRHPDSLAKFHSVPEFTYPKEHNLAPGDKLEPQDFSKGFPEHITMSITQYNTNPLLGKLEGCDGLKTGYIDESGYNLSLTAKRGETRYLSVTMKGPGANSREGQAGRVKDGTTLIEYGFKGFGDYRNPAIKKYFVPVTGASEKSVNLIPAFPDEPFSIPNISGTDLSENLDKVEVWLECPKFIKGKIDCGTEYGKIKIILSNYLLYEIPLVADRTLKDSNFIVKAADVLFPMISLAQSN